MIISVVIWMVIVLRVTKVSPVLPTIKPQLQYPNSDSAYPPKKKGKISFKNVLEKELLRSKIDIRT
jgi:hypothetical protein